MKHCFLLLFTFISITHAQIINRSFADVKLYEQVEPFHTDYLPVNDIHEIFYAQYGNQNGAPVIIFHGGPGAGCIDYWSSFFDMKHYHVIMFDQRGAMRSKPFGCMDDNTPQASVRDAEQLREHLGIEKWLVYGGSYGSLMALLYGQTHPERTLGFVMRGIFLGRKVDYEYLFFGMNAFFPEAWHEMVSLVPQNEQHDLIQALDKLVMDPDPTIHQPAADAFMFYDNLCAKVCTNPNELKKQPIESQLYLSIARAFIHYAANNFYLEENQLLNNMHHIAHLPAIIVHGRYDLICPPRNAYALHEAWPNAQLWFIPDAGHSSKERSVAGALKTALEEFKTIPSIH